MGKGQVTLRGFKDYSGASSPLFGASHPRPQGVKASINTSLTLSSVWASLAAEVEGRGEDDDAELKDDCRGMTTGCVVGS